MSAVEKVLAHGTTAARADREGETVAAGLRRLADDTDLLYDVVRIALLALADHLSPVTPDGGDQ